MPQNRDFKHLSLPMADLLGIQIVSADKDRVLAEMEVRADLCTEGAILHGGAVMALADTVGAIGAALNLDDGARTTTLESKTNFLGAARLQSKVIAESKPVHRGRQTSVWQTQITGADGRLLAVITQTQLVLP